MTSETLHEIGAGFEWKPAYAEQLAHIADTDEYIHDDDAHPAAYDWPTLKEAIKFRIREHLQGCFATARPVQLHPAATLLTPNLDDAASQSGLAASSDENADAEAKGDEEEEGEERASGGVMAADVQNFYASKRGPSSTTGVMEADEAAKQQRLVFGMLDDFDTQPPFTIQRLCELVVAPTAHYNSGAKWIGALKRCLAVTATRDAFPISPILASTGVPNGHADEAKSDVSELDMDRMDGLAQSAGTRSRSASVASSADPLFSPIPFLTDAPDDGTVSEVPELELSGADRTGADAVPSEVLNPAPVAEVQTDVAMPDTQPEAGTALAVHEALAQPEPLPSTPLGLPAGEVDEVDNADSSIHPLSATTTAAPGAHDADDHKDPPDADARDTKRRKSVASESDPRD